MASGIPVATARDVGDKSRSRRLGALPAFSHGEPPLTGMRRNVQKETQRIVHPAPASSRPRAQPSRLPQSPPAQKPPVQVEARSPRPPLTHETQSWSTSSRPGTHMAKPMIVGGYVEPSKKPRNVLRRKQSTMLREPSSIDAQKQPRFDYRRTGSSSSITKPQTPLDPVNLLSDRSINQSPGEIRAAQQVETHWPIAQPAQIYPELDRYRDILVPPSRDQLGRDALYRLATEDLPPPTPQFSGSSSHSRLSSFSASPSTRFSGSPGPGPYSRDTTPTSVSSQSPGLVAPSRLPAARLRQASPAETRPPVTRRRAGSVSNEGGSFSSDPHGLAAVREALTSSSSNSTVRAEEKKNSKPQRGRALEPPNPPPRTSSKYQRGRSVDEARPSQSPQIPSQQVMKSPSPRKLTKSPHGRAPHAAPSPQRRPTPPSRPSRDGTPDLYSQFGGPIPIIHSNLSSTSLTEKRQSGQLQPGSLLKTTTQRPSLDRARPSFSQESISASRAGIIPGSQASKHDTESTSSASGPGVSTLKSKFPFFGRRTKAGPEAIQAEKKREKVPRKGPAAGTGHEGYGRVGAVRRRSSANSNFQRGLPGLLSSSESLSTTLSTDPFLLERMSPVIIAGGEVVENQNSGSNLIRTESNQSFPWGRPSLESQAFSTTSSSAMEDNRQTLWPSPIISETIDPRRPSESHDEEEGSMKPTLAYRRANRGFQSQDNAPSSILKAIDTRAPSVASMATTIHTDDSFPDIQREHSHTLLQVNEPTKNLATRAKAPRKWTLFGRSQTNLSAKNEAESISATVQPSLNKPPAFYTIIDSPTQDGASDGQEINAIPNEPEGIPVAVMQVDYDRRPSTSSGTNPVVHARLEHNTTNIRSRTTGTIPQIWQLDTKQDRRRVEQKTSESSAGRPSRLPQVGRIPKVIARRPKQTSPKSFSRPFNRISVQLLPAQSTQPDQESIAKGPSPSESVAPTDIDTESQEKALASERLDKNQTSPDDLFILGQPGQEFLAFPPCENPEGTEGSESSSSDRPGYIAHIAQVPEPSAPFGEDEVWDEYNDLLQDAPPSPTSSCGVPFPLETYNSKLTKELAQPLESPTIMTEVVKDSRTSVATIKTPTTSSHYSEEMTARINAAFRFDSEPPVTPFSVSEFVSGYSDRNSNNPEPNEGQKVSLRDSSSSRGGEKDSNGSKRGSKGSNRTSGSSRLSEETPLSQVNLRVGSMTVSKWLTFGHVLFSPIREDLVDDDSSLKRQSILIIDGLGNDDWSFYAAETYPAVNFFNLSPRAPLPQEHKTTPSFPLSPTNHHQIQFMSYAEKFPFGPDSFTALVLRFPSAAPEAHYRKLISEAQRVIKPGGYIELSVLDIDLNNVGVRSRRAVRRLKERISTQDPELNLGSTADLILRLLGQKGFVDIKTCRVGVPVASSITNAPNKDAKKDERSLAEMMNDKTETGDANIAKMVSKVGRWWYNKCYEVPTGMGNSIWHNRALLAECEEWGTSLKLMVCHAKIPEAKGRVASI
ncbi:hypothetical protein GGS24DRAFT_108960 [Hypoxylon argillaceum]|nr:hypothetical protein GGS24DRAFT_108960 [Hypoxylon argillaceum]